MSMPKVLRGYWHSIDISTNFFHNMFAYGQTSDPLVILGHGDLISRFSEFALYPITQYMILLLSQYE